MKKSLLILLSISILLIITGCSSKKYAFQRDTKSLAQYDINQFYNLIKLEDHEIVKGNSSAILVDGYNISSRFCKAKNGYLTTDKHDIARNFGSVRQIYYEHKEMAMLGRVIKKYTNVINNAN